MLFQTQQLRTSLSLMMLSLPFKGQFLLSLIMRVLHALNFNLFLCSSTKSVAHLFVLTQINLFSEKRASLPHAMSTEHATCIGLVNCTALAHKALKSFGTSSPLFFLAHSSGQCGTALGTRFMD